MAKMQGDPLLRILLVMIVLSGFISGVDWRALKRPSEVFRNKGNLFRQGCEDNDEDAAQAEARSQETMTFQEFKKYRDTQRKERWRQKMMYNTEDESGPADESTTKTEGKGEQGDKQQRWAQEEVSPPKGKAGNTQSRDRPEEVFLPRLKPKTKTSPDRAEEVFLPKLKPNTPKSPDRAEEVVLPKLKPKSPKSSDGPDEVLSKLNTKRSNPSDGPRNGLLANSKSGESSDRQIKTGDKETQSVSLKRTQVEGHLLEESLPRPKSPRGAPDDEAPGSDNSARSSDKTCAECSPVWYHVLTAVIPAVWLTNIALIAWIFFSRETKYNMRIPRGLGKRIHGDSPAAIRAPLSIPPSISSSLSVSPFDRSRRNSLGLSSGLAEAYQKKNDSQIRQNKTVTHKRSNGDHPQAPDPPSLRSHVASRLPNGQGPLGLATISEISQEDRVINQEHTIYRRGNQMKHSEETLSDQKLSEAQKEQSNADKNLNDRYNHCTPGQGIERSSGTKDPPVVASYGLTGRSNIAETRSNCDFIDDSVYINPRTLSDAQSRSISRTAGELSEFLTDKKRMAQGDFSKGNFRNDGESQCQDVANQMKVYFDVATQMSLIDVNKTPAAEHQAQLASVTFRPLCLAERQNTPEFVDSTSPPLAHNAVANSNATGDAFFSGQHEPANTKSGEYSAAGTGDHIWRQEGCREAFCVHPPRGINPNLRMAETGNMDASDMHRTLRFDQHATTPQTANRDDQIQYKADSFILEGESQMAPPPLGYHVRTDFSNPDSSTNLCKIMKFDSVGHDLNAAGLLNTNDLFASRKTVSSCETDASSSSSGMWRSLINTQPPLIDALPSGRGHSGDRRMDSERKKRPRKLMIIGKVNCANVGHKRKTWKHDAKTQLGIGREDKYETFDKSKGLKRERKQDTARMAHAYPMTVKAKKKTDVGGRYRENVSPRTTNFCATSGSLRSLNDGTKQYFKVIDYAEKHNPQLFMKRNARYRSALKINGGINIKRVNLKRDPVDARRPVHRIAKATESQSCLDMAMECSQNSPNHRHRHASANDRLELLPTYYMNMNSNAGLSDPATEGAVGGQTQTEPASVENVPSTADHYISTSIDADVHATCSEVDSNLSPSFTNDGDDVITVVSLGKSDPSITASRSSDQIKLCGKGSEGEAQQKIQSFNDSERGKKRNLEPANSDKMVDFRGDNHFSRNTAVPTPRDSHINATHTGRHKKKTKTTDSAVSKQDNSMFKKIVATTASKEGRKLLLTKPRLEKQKPQIPAGDVHKAIAGSIEKCNKPAVDPQRFGKSTKCSEGHNENFETKMKTKSGYETYLDYIGYKEPHRHGRVLYNAQDQGVRSAESDHRYSPLKIVPSTSCKSEDASQIKRLVSLPETMPSQGSPKKPSMPVHYQHKPDIVEDSSSSELKSPTVTRASESTATPVPLKRESVSDSSVKMDIMDKQDAIKRVESPMKEFTDSPKKEITISPKKELSNLPENNEDLELTPTMVKESTADEIEVLRICPETKLMWVESPNCIQSIEAQKEILPRTRDSPSRKSLDIALKHRSKKSSAENGKGRNLECVAAKDDNGESSYGKAGAHATLSSKKKNTSRYKTHSRSPDGKRKRRNLKRTSNGAEDVQPETLKKLKSGEKLTDKRRKKKKLKPKGADEVEESAQNSGTTEHLVYKSRSRSNESNKITQTTMCAVSTGKLLDTATSEPSLLFLHSKRKPESRSASSTGRLVSNGQIIQNFNRQHVFKYEELKVKSQTTLSAESTSSASGSNVPILSAESLLPFPVSTTKAPAKAVQLVPCPKIKRHEKDLQEAELGWNSTFSSDDKAVAEKVKQNQKRAKVRYYIVKPKPKKTEKEVGASKLKRPAPRLNHADVDAADSGSEMDNSEIVLQERVKPGQGKSVQFSDNIEDLEASKDETAIDRPLRRPESDSILHHPITKTIMESTKTTGKVVDVETTAIVRALPQKKEEQRSPVMATRKRRPIWLKKATKEKATAAVVKPIEAVKAVAMGVPVKKLHSSDNMLKPSSRFNLHVYYPVKATIGSPKLSNTSLTDKRKVTYKTWINSIFMAAPMNKATKKLVAKAGSPVDIKEIVEGSSVDAADHLKASKSLHDGDVRAARSVPSLAPNKAGGVDMISGKKNKSSDDSRLVSQKKSKDKIRECWSPRGHCVIESKDHQIAIMKNCLGVVDGPTSPASSTNVDIVAGFKQKNGLSRTGEHGNRRRKDKKERKKTLHENSAKWQALASHEGRNVSDLEHVHYCGDMVELNVLNMGFTWVVQSVFNRLPFLNQRQHDSTSISTKDLATDQQVIE